MTQLESNNAMFQEVFDMIPETYRERYGIRLMTCDPCLYLDIEEARLTILNSDKKVRVGEDSHCIYIKVDDMTRITMYKNFNLIYTHL